MLERLQGIKFLVLDVDGTLTDGHMHIGDHDVHLKAFSVKDGIMVRRLKEEGCEVGIISHSIKKSSVEERADMLGIRYCKIGKGFDKGEQLVAWMQEMKLQKEQVAVMGDDINDLSMFAVAGLSACPADAGQEVRRVADVVLSTPGGKGCVREWADHYFFPAKTWTRT